MTELQMGLIGLGVAAVFGVFGYNKWQEMRQRKVAEKVSNLTLVQVPDEETFLLTLSLTTAVPTGTRSITREVRLVPRMRERR